MSPRLWWNAAGLALWLTISWTFQWIGLSLLSSHLLAMAVALVLMLVVRLVMDRRSSPEP